MSTDREPARQEPAPQEPAPQEPFLRELPLRDMPPKAAHFCLKLENFMDKDLGVEPRGKTLVLAFSGGADSLALLLAVKALAGRPFWTGCRLVVAHLDHALRAESAAEASAAADLAKALGLEFVSARRDVAALARAQRMGLEEAGRAARWAFLEETRQKHGADWVLAAHQLNDLAEDVLLRLLRGGAWPALGGMRALDEERRILRPLLLTPRAAVEEFLKALGQSWVEDASNKDQAFLRNRVRHELLPIFLRENPSFLESCARLWRLARLDEAWFKELLPALEPGQGEYSFSREYLRGLAPALRLRCYKAALQALGPGQALSSGLLALDAAWQRGEGGKTVQFPGPKVAVLRQGGIVFRRG